MLGASLSTCCSFRPSDREKRTALASGSAGYLLLRSLMRRLTLELSRVLRQAA